MKLTRWFNLNRFFSQNHENNLYFAFAWSKLKGFVFAWSLVTHCQWMLNRNTRKLDPSQICWVKENWMNERNLWIFGIKYQILIWIFHQSSSTSSSKLKYVKKKNSKSCNQHSSIWLQLNLNILLKFYFSNIFQNNLTWYSSIHCMLMLTLGITPSCLLSPLLSTRNCCSLW